MLEDLIRCNLTIDNLREKKSDLENQIEGLENEISEIEKVIQDFKENYVYSDPEGEYIHMDDAIYIESDGNYYHYNSDDIIEIDGDWYLKDSGDVVCDFRGDYILRGDAVYVDYDNEYYHTDEVYEFYEICADCHEWVPRDYAFYSESRQEYLCESCFEESNNIYNYSYKPDPIFFRGKKSKIKRFYGIELEIEIDKSIANDIDFSEIYLKEDSSIDNGFELVTHPLTYDYHKNFNWSDLLSKLRSEGGRSYNTDTCGIHIHVSKLKSLTTYKLLNFFSSNVDFIKKISQRKTENLNRWASIETDYKSFCEIVKHKNNKRYSAINLLNRNTVEVRIFRGTLNYNSFMKNIEFLDSLLFFLENTSIEDCDLTNYQNFIKTKKRYYNNLYSFMLKKGLICAL